MLEIKQVSKAYNPGTVREIGLFDHFSLTVARGQFACIIGSNGSGKTSLLNLICGSIQPDGGAILWKGQDITRQPEHARARFIGRIRQNPAQGTCANMTVLENLCLAGCKHQPMNLRRACNANQTAYYRDLLRPLGMGLENMLQARAGSLSGGERQALALGMCMLSPLELLILDEHTAALDPRSAETVMVLTGRAVRERGLTVIMVTHNLRHALCYGNRLIMMHEGGIVLDRQDDAKQNTQLDEVLHLFNTISIECGN